MATVKDMEKFLDEALEDRAGFKEIINQAILEEREKSTAIKSFTAELSERLVFLTGALCCTRDLKDKSKIPEALELCIDLVRDVYQNVDVKMKLLVG